MADPVELIPLLVVALLMISAGGGDVTAIRVTADGDHTVGATDDTLIVGGGTTTVPADGRVEGDLYVVGGTAVIDGEVTGEVVQLAGTLSIGESAAVGERLRLFAGERTVAADAVVPERSNIADLVAEQERAGVDPWWVLLRAVAAAVAGFVLAGRAPAALDTVGDAAVDHGLVSGTVGLLAVTTGTALVVFMALTVFLIPVSLFAVIAGVVVAWYALIAFGRLIGTHLPVSDPRRATAIGAAAVVSGVDAVGALPVIGTLVQGGVVLVGVGAVLITYFGLQPFEPVSLPE